MKKYLLGLGAILSAIAFSAFYQIDSEDKSKSLEISASNPKSEIDLYWFEVEVGHGTQNVFSNGEVIFIDGPLPISSAPDQGCPASAANSCVVGFSLAQLNPDMSLKNPNTSPEAVKSRRSTP